MARSLPGLRVCGPAGLRLAAAVSSAARVAEITGARFADLLDRIEADARAAAKARATAAAHAAGTGATAVLLALLPAAGVLLGYGIGTDPLRVLLHTRVGAACVTASLVLQVTGLAWSRRLGRAGREAP